jgi:hypothetical protein
MPFVKGRSGNPGGRPKGRPNQVTQEIRALAGALFDRDYWQRVRSQLREGTLHPSIEARLLAYAYGEPRSHDAAGPGLVVSIGFLSPSPAGPVAIDGRTPDATDEGGMASPARALLSCSE